VYRVALLMFFVVLALRGKDRASWVVVSVVCAAEAFAWAVYGHNDPELYIIQSTAALLGGTALAHIRTSAAVWQATVLALTLCAYAALAFDVAKGRSILIYDDYEAVIHGLVACQLLGVFPAVRARVGVWAGSLCASVASIPSGQRGKAK